MEFDGARIGCHLESLAPFGVALIEGAAHRLGTLVELGGLDWTARFRPIAAAATKLKAKSAYLDGEVAVLDNSGISSFGALQEALSAGEVSRMTYYAFDLLHLDGKDLTHLSFDSGKRVTDQLMNRGPFPAIS